MLSPTQMRNLIIGTIFVVGAAVWATMGEDPAGPLEARGEPLFPGITERLGRLMRLELEGSNEKTVLTLGVTGWVLTSLGDYPVDASRIRSFLQGLVRARRFEEKTANKSLFERMGLGQEATTASFFDDGEAPFLRISIGKRADRSSGNAALTFVYLEADGRAWTVKDFAKASPEALFWVDRSIARIPVERISRLEIKPTGGEAFALLRSEPGADQTQLML